MGSCCHNSKVAEGSITQTTECDNQSDRAEYYEASYDKK